VPYKRHRLTGLSARPGDIELTIALSHSDRWLGLMARLL
jgi:hypothetical protein